MKALLRLYNDFRYAAFAVELVEALLRLYEGSIKAL
jgi:hypothetical protein